MPRHNASSFLTRRNTVLALVALSLSTLTGGGLAQAQSWPAANKPITFINPFPPGGAVDAFGRPLARQLGTQLGTAIVVENKGGARWLHLVSGRGAPLHRPQHVPQPALRHHA